MFFIGKVRKWPHSSLLEINNHQYSLEKCANGFTAASWKFKTINISFEKRANVFTAAFWRFQNINNGFTAASC